MSLSLSRLNSEGQDRAGGATQKAAMTEKRRERIQEEEEDIMRDCGFKIIVIGCSFLGLG